eukprot:m.100928 g.100928  ORF g.100928 m.100928 type:complete len:278 (+) comp27288_c0_seq1:204-1037(+)
MSKLQRESKRRRCEGENTGNKPASKLRISDDQGKLMDSYQDYRFYAEKKYWGNRYDSAASDSNFEWFHDSADLVPLLELLIPKSDSFVIDLGCGTSELLSVIRATGHSGRLTGFDFIEAAIARCKADSIASNSDIEFHTTDITDMSAVLQPSSVDVVTEKGTIAGIVASPDYELRMPHLLTEINRVLTDTGVFISLSPHDPYDENEAKNGMNVLSEILLPPLVDAGHESGHYFTVDIHSSECFENIYAYVFTKHKRANTRRAKSGHAIETVIKFHEH